MIALFHCMAIIFLSTPVAGADNSKQDVPSIDAEAGPWSVDDSHGWIRRAGLRELPIRVRVSYGFLGVRRVDLEIATNAEGKAKFVGLPQDGERILYFRATKGRLKGVAVHSTGQNCEARHLIVLRPR